MIYTDVQLKEKIIRLMDIFENEVKKIDEKRRKVAGENIYCFREKSSNTQYGNFLEM